MVRGCKSQLNVGLFICGDRLVDEKEFYTFLGALINFYIEFGCVSCQMSFGSGSALQVGSSDELSGARWHC